MRKRSALILLLLCAMASARPARLTGHVVRVVDGDTVRVRLVGGEETIRLRNIDAPELGQPGGAESQRALARSLPEGSPVDIVTTGKDRYRRIIGEIYRPDGADVNVLQVRNGQAWVYTKYCRDPHYWEPLQEKARDEKLGLWKETNPIAPWEYRHR